MEPDRAIPDPDLLGDESLLRGQAESISHPRDEDSILGTVARMRDLGRRVTIQGARTGLCGGAVPTGGHVINMAHMNRILGMRIPRDGKGFILRVEPGISVSDLQLHARSRQLKLDGWDAGSREAAARFHDSGPHFFPPDPTETTASIGGAVSCNASGPRTFLYGTTRNFIEGIRLVRSDGSVLEIERGSCTFTDLHLDAAPGGHRLVLDLPVPRLTGIKNAAGYFSSYGMDLVDLIVGSEGTFGVISRVDVRVIPEPAERWGILCPIGDTSRVVRLVAELRSLTGLPDRCRIAALEYADSRALRLLRHMKPDIAESILPAGRNDAEAALLYVELHGEARDSMMDATGLVAESLGAHSGDIDRAMIATDDDELERVKTYRHAIPESVNLRMRSCKTREDTLTKVGTDFAVRLRDLGDLMESMESRLVGSGLEHVTFGHIGDCNLHTNILPRDRDEYEHALRLRQDFSEQVARLGGTLSAEHGLGKLKSRYLGLMYTDAEIEAMRKIQRTFDPVGMFDTGNIFGPRPGPAD